MVVYFKIVIWKRYTGASRLAVGWFDKASQELSRVLNGHIITDIRPPTYESHFWIYMSE